MTKFQSHPQWKAIQNIDKTLRANGFQSLVAGGAVRDLMLDRMPSDIDIATDAKPEQVSKLFPKTVLVGEAFGVCRIVIDEAVIEVASFRKDGPYRDGRKPESIEYSNPIEDARRRDFTVNAMFYDLEKNQVIDYVDGQRDVMQGVIRTVGDANQRFAEDKLRILRALRFQSQLGFRIEEGTLQAIRKHAVDIHQVSMERVRVEWEKLLLGPERLQAIERTHKSGLWQPLFGSWEFQSARYFKVFKDQSLSADRLWLLWFLLHHRGSTIELQKLNLLWKHPKKLAQRITYVHDNIPWLQKHSQWDAVDLALFLNEDRGRDTFFCFRKLVERKLESAFVRKMEEAYSYFQDGRLPVALVTGGDLIQYGMRPGPQVAERLKKAYRIQLEQGITLKEDVIKQVT